MEKGSDDGLCRDSFLFAVTTWRLLIKNIGLEYGSLESRETKDLNANPSFFQCVSSLTTNVLNMVLPNEEYMLDPPTLCINKNMRPIV